MAGTKPAIAKCNREDVNYSKRTRSEERKMNGMLAAPGFYDSNLS
jgi:hypothetical protein